MKPDDCIKCGRPAILLLDNIPYCVKHYNEETDREETDDRL